MPGIPEAIRRSRATVVYNCNLVNKRGHTDGFALWDYVAEINRFLGGERIDFVTFNKRRPSATLLARYRKEDSELVLSGERPKTAKRAKVIATDLLSRKQVVKSKVDAVAPLPLFHSP
ncbi:MAG: 2-phospho-L-lactate transferase CofD family protein [Candidatus Moraniibacteriota bacterium]